MEFDILPFLKNKQQNNQDCLLDNLMIQLNVKSSDLKSIQELSSFNKNQIIQKLKITWMNLRKSLEQMLLLLLIW